MDFLATNIIIYVLFVVQNRHIHKTHIHQEKFINVQSLYYSINIGFPKTKNHMVVYLCINILKINKKNESDKIFSIRHH